jgi:phosphoribosylamine---glycine ligase
MKEFNIPTATYQSFAKNEIIKALQYIESTPPPYVLKADGLAAGKGVVILDNANDAKAELQHMLVEEKFGDASKTVVIEQFLKGIELSVFVLTDGKNYKILPTAKDYKRIGEGDTGLNTGGMGAISPVPFADDVLMKKIEDRIVKPTIEGIQKRNMNYKGFVFIGLIKVGEEPYVIEYNVRMGDPETEVVLPRIKTDLISLLDATFKQTLDKETIEIDERAATTVMLVSGGYPEAYDKGKEITGIEDVQNAIVFHAGTKEKDGKVVTNGGRVLAITSLDTTWQKALKKSFQNVEKIHFERMYYRKDLGFDLL